MMFWLAIPLTLALYFMTRALYRRLPWPVINPVLIPTAVIIGLRLRHINHRGHGGSLGLQCHRLCFGRHLSRHPFRFFKT